MVRRIHLPVHCAPLERQTVVGDEVYKHLAPSEPGRLVVALPRCVSVETLISDCSPQRLDIATQSCGPRR